MREHEKMAAMLGALKALQSAFTAMSAAFETMTTAFEICAELMPDEAEFVTETITPAADPERDAGDIVNPADCAECLCNTCANIEKCVAAPEGKRLIGLLPYPCAACLSGMRYTSLDDTCAGYVKGSGNYV
jgi:hypothetical protein